MRRRPRVDRARRSLPRAGLVALALAAGVLLALPVSAQPLRPDTDSDDGKQVSGTFGARASATLYDEDWYLGITPFLSLEIDDLAIARDSPLFDSPQVHPLRLQFETPLHLRVRDNAPRATTPRFRGAQWDTPSEYLRVLRWAEYAAPYDGVYFRGGELSNVRVGHRTIVDAYANALDSDRFQWGLHHNLNTVYGGYEAFIDDVTNPDVMGGRLWARPWAFVDPGHAMRRLAVGVTVAADQAAPTMLAERPVGGGLESNEHGDVVVTGAAPTAVLGWDVEYLVVASDRVSLTPYLDVNTHLGRGTGMHAGSFFGFKLSRSVVLDLRAEYRRLGRRYLPAYIGRIYEVERLAYRTLPGDDIPLTKLTWSGRTLQPRRNGYYAELGLNIADKAFISGGFADEEGANNNSAWMQLRVPVISVLQFGAYFVNTRFEGASGLFDLDDALVVAELRVSPLKWLFVDGQFRRRWEVNNSGRYAPANDWWIGAGVSFGF